MSTNNTEESSGTNSDQQEERIGLISQLLSKKTETGLWLTRIITIFYTFLYLFSINSGNSYQKALLSSAATSALRLHQRLGPEFRFSRQFLAQLLSEDSAHYLLFSVIFVFNFPISLALLPISLFAFLHFSSYSLTLITKSGINDGVVVSLLSRVVQQYQRSILQTVALTEIMIMPSILFGILSGIQSIITPFIYYRFLSLRYSSRRNPYSRQMFHELRISTEYLVFKPQCPLFIRNIVIQLIQLISRLAPNTLQ